MPQPCLPVRPAFLSFLLAAPTLALSAVSEARPVRILLDQAPLTLNPRLALDAASQRLGSLMFRGLTRVDENLAVQPALASRWEKGPKGLSWSFEIPMGDIAPRDHAGAFITPMALKECLENYRVGSPRSPLMAAFPSWIGTELAPTGDRITLRLSRPDPYLPRNATLLRFFRTTGASSPCMANAASNDGGTWIGSGPYAIPKKYGEGESLLSFRPHEPGWLPADFLVSRDEGTRALKLLRGEADLAQNSLSLAKTRWLVQTARDRFKVIERDGVNVSYLAFDLRDPVTKRWEVRRALALAIDRESIIQHKMFGYGARADSFLAPLLPESLSDAKGVPFDPEEAERILEKAGFPRDAKGVRLRLRYRTTPQREGYETAVMLREMWKRIGVDLELSVVEPGMFLASIRKGGFQLYSSRWVGVADASILVRALRSGQSGNRVGIQDPQLDQLLDRVLDEPREPARLEAIRDAQKRMNELLPYFPLWFWRNALIGRPEWTQGLRPEKLSLSGAFEPLLRELSRLAESRADLNPSKTPEQERTP